MRFLQETIDITKLLQRIERVKAFQLVGSALIAEETAKDLDVLVYVEPVDPLMASCWADADSSGFSGARWLFGSDWNLVSGEYDDVDDTWGSLRRGFVNLIVTTDKEWYQRAVIANEVCVALKLRDKGDRVVVYRVVRDMQDAETANQKRDGGR